MTQQNWKCDTIKTADGTVCRHCRLWPDLCTCNPEHPIRQIFADYWIEAARQEFCRRYYEENGVTQ